ncbi:MAG TPA: VanZ family protein [Candidatus Solibacter sp.]|nr:VanZ family protein [Candidatus Solibacter sp.]
MSDPQPWRNPRPAPQMQELQPRLRKLLLPEWFRAWWPALVWACVIFTLSTDSFSAEQTANILSPVVRWLFPHLTQDQFDLIHHLIRKSAHFTEYFIFCALLFRGFCGDRKGWRWTWGFSAWFVAAGYSCLDEIHQAFVVSRTASPYDSLLDSIGALFAFALLYLWFRFRCPKPPALQEPVQ